MYVLKLLPIHGTHCLFFLEFRVIDKVKYQFLSNRPYLNDAVRFHFCFAKPNEIVSRAFAVNWSNSLARTGLHFALRPVLIKQQSGTVIGFRDVLVMNGMFLSSTKGTAISTTVVSAFDSRRHVGCRSLLFLQS